MEPTLETARSVHHDASSVGTPPCSRGATVSSRNPPVAEPGRNSVPEAVERATLSSPDRVTAPWPQGKGEAHGSGHVGVHRVGPSCKGRTQDKRG